MCKRTRKKSIIIDCRNLCMEKKKKNCDPLSCFCVFPLPFFFSHKSRSSNSQYEYWNKIYLCIHCDYIFWIVFFSFPFFWWNNFWEGILKDKNNIYVFMKNIFTLYISFFLSFPLSISLSLSSLSLLFNNIFENERISLNFGEKREIWKVFLFKFSA